jgi:hypothetical protein
MNGGTIFNHRVVSLAAMATVNINEVKVAGFDLHILSLVLNMCHPVLYWEVAGNLLGEPSRAGGRQTPQGTLHLSQD